MELSVCVLALAHCVLCLQVDENTRKSLFKLRSTWEDVFPLKKLYALDVRVNGVDPAWPIKALPPSVSNASIHVNPKFLKQSDDALSPQPTPSKPPALQAAPSPLQATPPAPHAPPPALVTPVLSSSLTQESLIRQQLLAKQKQLLELQQKKIELELEQTKAQLMGGFVMPPAVPVKPGPPAAPGVRPWLPPPQPDPKPPTRDPRINRVAGTPTGKKESHAHTGSAAVTLEKPPRPEKPRTPRKEAPKPPTTTATTPITKSVQMKPKPAENETKKDPRLKKRGGGAIKEEEPKKKKEEPLRGGGNKGKLLNGSKHEEEKMEFKAGGNARTHARKRSRSPPVSPPKRKERRRTRSSSLSPPPPSHKPGKPPRREPEHGKKKSQSESRRSKRPVEDPLHPPHPPRGHDGAKEGKDGPAPPHRWRSGWEENKHPKPEDPHLKPATPRHKPYSTPTRPQTPRTAKHRLSVDANMQIPEVLNSVSKKDLLRRASKRLESGEISQEDFLNMAHQIKHFFQYQEEKQRPDSWDPLSGLPRPPLTSVAPRPPLTSGAPRPPPASGGPRPPPASMDAAELSYYEHKLKLRKTQVNRRAAGEEWEGDESPEEGEGEAEADPPGKYSRGPRDRPAGERRSKEAEEPRPPLGPMIEEYNHGKEFPTLKSLPGLRFRRRADPREPAEREWTSPLTERQRLSEEKSGYEAPRRYDPRRPEAPPPSQSPAEGLRFERERLSPPKDPESPAPRFESPTSEHSDDGPLEPPPSHLPPPKSILKAPIRPLPSVRHSDSPGHTPPQDGGVPPPPQRYDGGPPAPTNRPPAGWFEGGVRYDDPPRFDGPHQPSRFEAGGPHHFDSPSHPPHGPMRGFEGPPHPQGPGRFDGPPRFDGPGHFEGPMRRFDPPCPGPMGFQQRPLHFDGPPNQMRFDGPMRFDSPVQQGPRFDLGPHQGGPPHYEGPMRFGPQHNMQPPMRPMAPPLYDGPLAPQQNFNMAPQPMNPQQFPMAFPQPGGNFNLQPAYSQPGPGNFYNPAAPAMQQPMLGALGQPFLPQNSVPYVQTPAPPPENHFGQVDVNDLLNKLISNGIIKPSLPDAPPTSKEPVLVLPAAPPVAVEEEEEEAEEEEDENLPDLTGFKVDHMKLRYECVVLRLYSGNQCCLCSMRFTAKQTDLYADHLDWHFRQNHAGKVVGKRITHRRWYYGLRDWVEFEEIADLEERAKSTFFEKVNEEEVQKSQAAAKEKEFQSVKATKDAVRELCEICQEPFETYWVEEEEDWFLKDAVRVDDKNFHPACFEDYKNTSSYVDVTPSPSKLLTEHPLTAFIKTEEEEEQGGRTSCAFAKVKQEVAEPMACSLPVVKSEEAEVLTAACPSEEGPSEEGRNEAVLSEGRNEDVLSEGRNEDVLSEDVGRNEGRSEDVLSEDVLSEDVGRNEDSDRNEDAGRNEAQ
ncbi:hypothetical protein KUCAC02_031414 [Chaenocephalus aceratus]|nr:hypothetical protein KUCAC02_031414 [Chaenocephalus aceratus]